MKGLPMPTIFIVEDDRNISRFIELELQYEGFVSEVAYDGKQALENFNPQKHDLIILDLMLPFLSGIEVCRRIRQQSNVPIMILTAKGDTMDKVMGLDMGADDYLTKPFEIEELLARIRRMLHRAATSESTSPGGLHIDKNQHIVSIDHEEVDLTKTEFDLLCYLYDNEKIALTRDQILDKVWGYDYFGDTKVVDVYIRYLRSKIDEPYHKKYIHTVRGVGYMFKFTEQPINAQIQAPEKG